MERPRWTYQPIHLSFVGIPPGQPALWGVDNFCKKLCSQPCQDPWIPLAYIGKAQSQVTMTSVNIPDVTSTAEQQLTELAQAVIDRPWSFACQEASAALEDMPSAREAALRILSGGGRMGETKDSRDAVALCDTPASGSGAQGDVAPSRSVPTALHYEGGTSCSDS